MDNQTIFTTVAEHLLTQNKKSLSERDGDLQCAYRGDDGLKCAVGILITDEHYLPKLEGRAACAAAVHRALELSLGISVDKDTETLLVALQGIHDDKQPEDWNNHLFGVAERFGFQVSPLMQHRAS